MSAAAGILFFTGCALRAPDRPEGRICCTGCQPRIYPDYTGIVIPPNSAPLNFMILEKGNRFHVSIRTGEGRYIEISGSKPEIMIPAKAWRSLLESTGNRQILFDVFTGDETGWKKYRTFADTVAVEPADPYIVYRKINLCVKWMNMGIFQRNTGTFSEKPLLSSSDMPGACMNCHSFRRGNPDEMIVQLRSADLGTPMLMGRPQGGKLCVEAVNTATSFTSGKAGFTAWHPTAGLVAFSVNSFIMLYHTAAQEVRDVFDRSSDLALYRTESRSIERIDRASSTDRIETMPEWSPDGRYLYFCSAPILWTDFSKAPPDNFEKVKYSLLRIAYNAADDSWGAVDTVLSPRQTGLSISQPRISPDGRFLLFCMHQYGGYPHTQKSSDLYMLEISTGKYRRLGINSEYQEMWHGWSSNGRWILFSSKRDDGIFTRIYFSYVDCSGNTHAPFIMPQKNPAFYGSFIKSYNVPEFATGPVPYSERDLLKTIRSPAKVKVRLPSEAEAAQSGSTAWEKLRTK